MNLSVHLNVTEHGRVVGRRLVSAELLSANARTVWVRVGGNVIKRKVRRDLTREDALRVADWRRGPV